MHRRSIYYKFAPFFNKIQANWKEPSAQRLKSQDKRMYQIRNVLYKMERLLCLYVRSQKLSFTSCTNNHNKEGAEAELTRDEE